MIFISKFVFTYSQSITSPFPNCLQLHDDILLIANKDAIFFTDLLFRETGVYLDYINSNANYQNNLDKLLLAQYDEEYEDNIICIINNYIYFIEYDYHEIELIYYVPLGDIMIDALSLNLLAYKKDKNNYYHFFIICITNENSKKILSIFHYKLKGYDISLESHKYYQPFYLDYPGIKINSDYFTCQIMNSDKKGDVLTCAYFAYDNKLIVVQSFDIENGIQEIEEYYSKFPIDNLNVITSTISPDKKNMFVCYSPTNKYGYCFVYNFDTNKIFNNKPVIEQCESQNRFFRLNYFPQTEEYLFICKNKNEKFSVVKFDKNFEKINPENITSVNFEITNHYAFNSISLAYNKNYNSYIIITDSKSNTDSSLRTRSFYVTTDFSQSFESNSDMPAEFEEIYEHNNFIIDETNKYFVYTKGYTFYANSRDHKKIKINFMDENDLILRTYDNKKIDASLYWMEIKYNIDNLVVYVDGEERKVENNERINNVTELYYFPEFSNYTSEFRLIFCLYLKNNTLASPVSTQIVIKSCKENCTCSDSNAVCDGCLEDFENYKFYGNCIGKDDLNGKYLSNGIYFDCNEMCKTCSEFSEGLPNMKCLTCYTERGDYQEGNNCYKKECGNLYYFDKDTGMKICINETVCPEDYPNQKDGTNQCIEETQDQQSSIGDSSTTKTEKIFGTDNSIENTSTEENSNSEGVSQTSFSKESSDSNSEENSESQITEETHITETEGNTEAKKSEENSGTSNNEDEEDAYNFVINLIQEEIGKENIDQVNKTYSILSNIIKNGNISFTKEDITISGVNITYQLTTSEHQKNANLKSNVSVIDLGECEKIIKRNISYENDPTPLLILKIDIKKAETKSIAVEYEIYNPYTKEKIDLSICSNTKIEIYSPTNLDNNEISLYSNLNEQGYDLFDVNNSFFIDPCSIYTSENGTDVSLKDRKNYYYNEDIVLCEDNCQYIKYYLDSNKAHCQCNVKSSVNVENDQVFSPKILMEQFYKIDTYANFEVLFCYKLVFSSKGLKKNICFYILIILLAFFLTSMIINLFTAVKKLEQIIFKIFQDRFMFFFMQKIIMEGRRKRNLKANENQKNENDNKGQDKPKMKLNWIERLKLSKQKKENSPNQKDIDINKINLYNPIELEKKDKNKIQSKIINDSKVIFSESIEENTPSHKNIFNLNQLKKKKTMLCKSHKIDNINNEIKKGKLRHSGSNFCENHKNKNNIYKETKIGNKDNKEKPPKRTKDLNENSIEEKSRKKGESPKLSSKKIRKKKNKNISKSNSKENGFSASSISIIHLKKSKYKNIKKKLFQSCESIEEKKKEKKNKDKKEEKTKEEGKKPDNKNSKYIDEELNRMDYKNALINDKRNYCQYYWSYLKKKHIIILTFVSNDDYNVFLLKFSLFVISIALFFSINTFFYRDNTFHQIYSQQGKYSLIYQIPQVLYSTLISFVMTSLLKKLSLSQNELISIKKELDRAKSNQLASDVKKWFKIKLYSFFFVGLFLLLFFWYYLTSFGAVYQNTQIHLIKDTFLSFSISMGYPFIINFIPSLLRLISLKDKKQKSVCLYKSSQLVALC